jgi:hypothetical protein
MDIYAQSIQEWQWFYATVAGACATVIGLIFVALSNNVDILTRRENAESMRLAKQTFSDIILVLLMALSFLVPRQGRGGLVLSLWVLALVWILAVQKSFREALQEQKGHVRLGYLLHVFGLSALGCLGLILIGLLLRLGHIDSIHWLVFVLAALLASAMRNAWYLLVHVRSGTAEGSRP